MPKYSKIAILFLLTVLLFTSCASRKKTVAPAPPQSFEWLTANLSIQAEGNGMAYNDLSGLRAKISNDSVWLLNRLEKTYLAEPLDSVSAQLGIPLSLPLVQILLLDNNQGLAPVENQTVQLRTFVMGDLSAKIRYNNIRLDEETTFPLKITDKMERIRLLKKQ